MYVRLWHVQVPILATWTFYCNKRRKFLFSFQDKNCFLNRLRIHIKNVAFFTSLSVNFQAYNVKTVDIISDKSNMLNFILFIGKNTKCSYMQRLVLRGNRGTCVLIAKKNLL